MSYSNQSRPPLERFQRIITILKSGKHVPTIRLAEELEVSVKTIQRDLDFMRDRLLLPIKNDGMAKGREFGACGFYLDETINVCPCCSGRIEP